MLSVLSFSKFVVVILAVSCSWKHRFAFVFIDAEFVEFESVL